MTSENVYQEIERRMKHLAATLARPPASVQDLLDITFTGVSLAETVTVTLDFRGALRGVHIKEGTVIAGDERALCTAIMEAHANAVRAMTTAMTELPPPEAKPAVVTRNRRPLPRFAATDDVEETGPILRPAGRSLPPR
jgi:DNA-binding protein YbaB